MGRRRGVVFFPDRVGVLVGVLLASGGPFVAKTASPHTLAFVPAPAVLRSHPPTGGSGAVVTKEPPRSRSVSGSSRVVLFGLVRHILFRSQAPKKKKDANDAPQNNKEDDKGGGKKQKRRRGAKKATTGAPYTFPEPPYLSLSEELQLTSLGHRLPEAGTLGSDPAAARRLLDDEHRRTTNRRDAAALSAFLDDTGDDLPTDGDLWEAARREYRATQAFAKLVEPGSNGRRKTLDLGEDPDLSASTVSPRGEDVDAALRRTWPDLSVFTKLLTQEALFRLRVLGPAFAEPLKEESRWRRSAYKAFLDFVDGEGLFPPEANVTQLVDAMPGSIRESRRVEAIYADLVERRDALREAQLQGEDWERRAAYRQRYRLLDGTEKQTMLLEASTSSGSSSQVPRAASGKRSTTTTGAPAEKQEDAPRRRRRGWLRRLFFR